MTAHFPHTIDTMFLNCNLATMTQNQLSVINSAALSVTDGKISWLGKEKHLPPNYKHQIANQTQIIDCQQMWILPGFVDCHTHAVWAGSRSKEFQQRLQGVSYEDIAKTGGGILSTVVATRAATPDQLYCLAEKRLKALMSQGITTIEIKSGYGLDLESELKILSTIQQLNDNLSIHIEPTFLGAHALPLEFKTNPDGYIDFLIQQVLPEIRDQGIATAVDAFCENIAFSREQTKRYFKAAIDLGYKIKLHAEQLSNSNGSGLAADMNAISCDHLEYLSKSDAKKMAENNVIAVLLPGAYYYLNQAQKPPVQILRNLNTPMALATDLNPGSSPIFSMTLILNMGCNLFGLTCEEALLGATINGAKALKLENTKGSLEIGKDADLVVWNIQNPIDLCYQAGINCVEKTMINGVFSTLS